LYKAAFAGTLKNFTGVSDPFERPDGCVVISPVPKEKLAVPLRAYLPNLRLKQKVLVLGSAPSLLRTLRSKGLVTNDPDGHDSLSWAYPGSALVREFQPAKIVYIVDKNEVANPGTTNDLSASFGTSSFSKDEYRQAWGSVFSAASTDLDELSKYLGVELRS
jgi:hypothetical protein